MNVIESVVWINYYLKHECNIQLQRLAVAYSFKIPLQRIFSTQKCQEWTRNFPTGAESSDEGAKIRSAEYYKC